MLALSNIMRLRTPLPAAVENCRANAPGLLRSNNFKMLQILALLCFILEKENWNIRSLVNKTYISNNVSLILYHRFQYFSLSLFFISPLLNVCLSFRLPSIFASCTQFLPATSLILFSLRLYSSTLFFPVFNSDLPNII